MTTAERPRPRGSDDVELAANDGVSEGAVLVTYSTTHASLQAPHLNSLGWLSLRSVQDTCISPVLAATHPFSPPRLRQTRRRLPLTVSHADRRLGWSKRLYVGPDQGPLNPCLPRLDHFCGLVGRGACRGTGHAVR